MTTPSADDFLAAARREKNAPRDLTPGADSTRETLAAFLALPAPPPSNGPTDLRWTHTWKDRLRAAMTLALGDILEPLLLLPPQRGHRFIFTSEDVILAPRQAGEPVTALLWLTAHYNTQSGLKSKNVFVTQPRLDIEAEFDGTAYTHWTLRDSTRTALIDGELCTKQTLTSDLGELRRALGAAVARMAPERLDEIADLIAKSNERNNAPVVIQSLKLRR